MSRPWRSSPEKYSAIVGAPKGNGFSLVDVVGAEVSPLTSGTGDADCDWKLKLELISNVTL